MSTTVMVYRLGVALRDVVPPVWRRILVTGDTTLGQLHRTLQAAMGWHDTHLHHFIVGKTLYGTSDRHTGFDRLSERNVTVGQVAPHVKARFVYEYDFGDSWVHEIEVEAIAPADERTRYPVCAAGGGACPPEDCGGASGYAELLEALSNPAHPEHASIRDWLGRPFDPKRFELADANRRLARNRSSSPRPARART